MMESCLSLAPFGGNGDKNDSKGGDGDKGTMALVDDDNITSTTSSERSKRSVQQWKGRKKSVAAATSASSNNDSNDDVDVCRTPNRKPRAMDIWKLRERRRKGDSGKRKDSTDQLHPSTPHFAKPTTPSRNFTGGQQLWGSKRDNFNSSSPCCSAATSPTTTLSSITPPTSPQITTTQSLSTIPMPPLLYSVEDKEDHDSSTHRIQEEEKSKECLSSSTLPRPPPPLSMDDTAVPETPILREKKDDCEEDEADEDEEDEDEETSTSVAEQLALRRKMSTFVLPLIMSPTKSKRRRRMSMDVLPLIIASQSKEKAAPSSSASFKPPLEEQQNEEKNHRTTSPTTERDVVQFNRGVECRLVPNLDSYSTSRFARLWYSVEECQQMIVESQVTLEKVLNNEPLDEHNESFRGLEYKTPEGFHKRSRIKSQAIQAVLDEQYHQWEEHIHDDDLIRCAYLQYSTKCLEYAQGVGMKDETIAQEIAKEEPTKQEDSSKSRCRSKSKTRSTRKKKSSDTRRKSSSKKLSSAVASGATDCDSPVNNRSLATEPVCKA